MKTLRAWFVRAAGLALAVGAASLLLTGSEASAGGGCRGAPVTEGRGTTVHLSGSCFSPTILHVEPGATVTWINDRDKASHTVTGANASWGDFEEILPHESVSQQFTEPGLYPYYCFLHPGMIGAVVVGDVSDATGAYLASLSGGAQPEAAVNAAPTGDGSGTNGVRLYAVIVATVSIAAAAGGFVLGVRASR